jgi:outer membrane lipoprotein SlyB
MEPTTTRTSPLVVIASVAVILFSAVGIATMTGLIPNSMSKSVPTATVDAPAQGLTAGAGTPGAPDASAAAQPPAPVPAPPGASGASGSAATAAAAGAAAGAVVGSPSGTSEPPKTTHKSAKRKHPEAGGQPTNVAAAAPVAGAAADSAAPPPPPVCGNCGQIDAIDPVVEKGQASGLGAIAGGVLGVVVGHQVGHGDGKTAATILGGAGGALAGNELEKNVKKTSHYVVKVAMNDGTTKTVTMRSKPQFVVGERVRIVNGGLQHD